MFDILDILGITTIMDSIKSNCEKVKSTFIKPEVEPIKFQFRPRNLDEYIGQEKAKEKLKVYMDMILYKKPAHILLSGNAGHGKTSLSIVIANELKFDMNFFIGGNLKIDNIINFLGKNQDTKKPNIVFIDEVATVPKETLEFMLPIIEDFQVNNLKLRPFILIGATTDKHLLIKKCNPFVDRIGCQIDMEDYTKEDIIKILKQYNEQLYKLNVDENVFEKLAENTRYCPRIALSYFDMLAVVKDINKVMEMNNIISDGLTAKDIKVLSMLKELDKPVGLDYLSILANTTKSEFSTVYEPYLLRQGYLARTQKGRIITNKGKSILNI